MTIYDFFEFERWIVEQALDEQRTYEKVDYQTTIREHFCYESEDEKSVEVGFYIWIFAESLLEYGAIKSAIISILGSRTEIIEFDSNSKFGKRYNFLIRVEDK